MTRADPIRSALDKPELERLWRAARDRLERNGRTLDTGPVPLADLTDSEIAAICGVLGRRKPRGDRMNIKLDVLDAKLRASPIQIGLIEALEWMSGTVHDRPAEREEARQAAAGVWLAALAHPAMRDDRVRDWLESLRARGRIARLAVDDPIGLALGALDGVEWLMTNRSTLVSRPIPLSAFAATQLGDAHALDLESPTGTLLTDAVQFLAGTNDERAAWLEFGIRLDRLSSSALEYMLPGTPGSLAALAAEASEPLRVTQRMLDRGFGLDADAITQVFVCENPAILSLAADVLGNRSRPLVCLEGMPKTVTGSLLQQLNDVGAELLVHTDLDQGGIAIASHLISQYGATPWRMARTDYLDALNGPTTGLPQTIGATPWDRGLSEAMNDHGRAVHEEAIFTTLLDDLRTA